MTKSSIAAGTLLFTGGLLLCPQPAQADTPTQIRLHVIAASTDDGTTIANTVTPSQICTSIANANPVYAAAGIRFVFDQSTDWEPVNNSALEDLSRPANWWVTHNAEADKHKGKLVIFLGSPGSAAYAYPPDSAGVLAPRPGQPLPTTNVKYVSYYNNASIVALKANISAFPHEIGHYLGLFHTFPSWNSVTDIQAALLVAEAPGPSGVEGDLLSDTPPDPGTQVVDDQYGGKANRCTTSGPVAVAGYTLNPDRHNIMSYFGCAPYEFSPQQIDMIKATLATSDRNDLISGHFFGDDFSLPNRDFCNGSGDTLLTGDFNGDHHADLLCNAANGTMSIDFANTKGEFWSTEWSQANRNFCMQSGDRLLVGDFDGDGQDDLLCNAANGAIFVDLADDSGHFTGSDWSMSGRNFCQQPNDHLRAGYFNTDNRADLVCNAGNGTIFVDYADINGHFTGSDWQLSNRNFCQTTGDVLVVGDFNHDGHDDLLCNSTNGTIAVDYANTNGEFWATDWSLANRNYCNPNTSTLLAADFNGDGYVDLLCDTNGALTVDIANSNGEFWKTDWVFPDRNFCTMSGRKFVVGDFDGDSGADLACVGGSGSIGVDRVEVQPVQTTDCITTP
jgi:FG-GAP-like repeat